MPPECWPRWRGEILQSFDDFEEFAGFGVQGGRGWLCDRAFGQRLHVEAQHFARLAGGQFPAIRNHVGRHRRAVPAVTLIDILDGGFPLFAARQIDIDIGPFAPLFGEKTFEQQIHPDRVHRRNAQRITDRAIGRRAAALAENAFLAAEAHDIPDDQEVTAQLQFVNQRQFAFDLLPRAIVVRDIAAARALIGEFPEQRGHGLARRQGIFRELVAEIFERELQARGDGLRVGNGLGDIGEKRRHFVRAFQLPLGIARQQAACPVERGLVVEAGKDIQHLPLRFGRVTTAVGGDQGELQAAGEVHGGLIAGFFVAIEVAL